MSVCECGGGELHYLCEQPVTEPTVEVCRYVRPRRTVVHQRLDAAALLNYTAEDRRAMVREAEMYGRALGYIRPVAP